MTKHFACMLSKKMHDRPDLLKQDISSWIAGTGYRCFFAPSNSALESNIEVSDLRGFLKSWNLPSECDARLHRRYWVVDFGMNVPGPGATSQLLSFARGKYPFGEVGLLLYWCGNQHRLPPIGALSATDVGTIDPEIDPDALPLNRIVFFPIRASETA
jgi:hypothetical protein